MLHLPLIAKVAIGVGAAVAGYFVVKKVVEPETKYVYTRDESDTVDIQTKEEKIEELKVKAVNRIAGGLKWVNEHQDQVQGFVTIITAASAMIGLANGIKQFGMKNRIDKKLDTIGKASAKVWYETGWNTCLTETRKQISDAINDPNDHVFEILDYNGLSLLKVNCSEVA